MQADKPKFWMCLMDTYTCNPNRIRSIVLRWMDSYIEW